jgi:hypothetical protein
VVHELRDTDEAAEDLETRGRRMHIEEIADAGERTCTLVPFTEQLRARLRERVASAHIGRCG